MSGSAPRASYSGVRFTMGVPFELNHGDPTVAPSPLNITAMFWNWQGGYKFLKADMNSTGLAAKPAMHKTGMDHGAAKQGHGDGEASGFSSTWAAPCALPLRARRVLRPAKIPTASP